MSKIFIICRDYEYQDNCWFALRKIGFEVEVLEDIIEGLRELSWFRPALIIWEMDAKNSIEMKALSDLRKKYGRVPLILVLEKDQVSDELVQMCEKVVLKSEPIKNLTNKVVELIGRPTSRREIRKDLREKEMERVPLANY